MDIDIQVQDVCSNAMSHVIVYMYTGHVTVTSKDLIPLYTLCQRLKMRGDIKKQLLINIRNQYQTNISMIIPYLIQAQSVENQSLKKEIYTSIYDKISNVENGKIRLKSIGLHQLSLPLFTELFIKSVSLSLSMSNMNDTKHIPYDIIIQYIHHFTFNADLHYARFVYVISLFFNE